MSTHNIEHIKTVKIDDSIELRIVPMFSDNYGYIVVEKKTGLGAVVDPADHGVMLQALKRMPDVKITQVWCTHKHSDHCGGNDAFATAYPGIEIYGPVHETEHVPAITIPCEDGAIFKLGDIDVRVLYVPCHTRGHIAFFANSGTARVLAAGDCLFTGGCGRFFEGAPEEMLSIMDKFAELPDDTVCCPAHEYTIGNFSFNASVDSSLQGALENIRGQRDRGEFTVPTTIGAEKKHNLFMLTRTERVQFLTASAAGESTAALGDPVKTMSLLREMKNNFK
jgi:hydroxyacylglutathione hydrolase